MAENEKQTNKERLKDITDSIERGILDLFQSDKYAEYLRTMSRFHRYSVNNQMLIYMQKPDATLVAGFNKWRDQFERNVMKGEKGIKIIAPTPFKKKIEQEKRDPDTNLPMLDADGKVIVEEKEIKIPMFKPVTVFDVSQTDGKPLPQLASDLQGNVQNYDVFMEALRRSSPVPIDFKPIADNADGFFSLDDQSITIREGMSEVQTVSAVVHEIAHSKLHNNKKIEEPKGATKYQEIEIFDIPGLFSNGRIAAADVPEGMYIYDLRGSDDDPGIPVAVEEHVVVNHAGSLVTAKPLELGEDGRLMLTEDEGLNFVGGEISAYRFANEQRKDRNTEEVEAESISFAVCAYYGIATGENSFGYIATWSKDKDLKELRESLETINKTSSELITDIDRNYVEIMKEREAEISVEPEKPLSEMNVLEMIDYFMDQGMTEEQANDLANSEWQARKITEKPVKQEPVLQTATEEAMYLLDNSQYLHVQITDGGAWDFSLFDKDSLSLVDGGLLDNPELSIEPARDAILSEMGLAPQTIDTVSADKMQETLDAVQNAAEDEFAKIAAKVNAEAAIEPPVEEAPPAQALENGYMPDPSMSIEAMNAYGYTDENMLPLSKERALELMERDVTVYMLYDDNSEAMAFEPEDIQMFSGMFAVERADWERVRGEIPPMDEALVRQKMEQAFQNNPADAYAIYQLSRDEATTDLRFMDSEWLQKKGLEPNKDNYELIYTGTLASNGSQLEKLEDIYRTFNIDHPADFRGHSLSVSDIVALKEQGVVSYHYVDSIGYKELPTFDKNYLKSAEMQMEDDYGMIDGIVNNGAKQPEKLEKKPPVKAADDRSKRPSVLAKLRQYQAEDKQITAKHRSAERAEI